jgi:hypothetical protein
VGDGGVRFEDLSIYNRPVRSLLAILQLLLLSLPTFASFAALGGSSEAKLPACCRRAGAHHCMITAAQQAALWDGVGVKAKPQPCPFIPKALPAAQHAPTSLVPAAMIFAQILSHPASAAQTLARFRISQDRSRQKRGPPAVA